MIRLPSRLFLTLAATLAPSAPTFAQQQPETFTLPEATPTPSPAPAGPADERAGVAIPPRAAPAAPATPVIQPLPAATPTRPAIQAPRDLLDPSPAPPRPSPQAGASAPAPAPAATASAAPQSAPPASTAGDPVTLPSAAPQSLPATPAPATGPSVAVGEPIALPDWWPFAAAGLGALALLGGAAMLGRRRKPKVRRLAAPVAGGDAPAPAPDLPRLDLTLEIIGATRSVMMFTLQYRLVIANRSERAVTDISLGVQLACARASTNASGGNAPSAGAAQALTQIARVGPQQTRSTTGEVQLPLSAIQPLRQGMTPLFVPLVHVTLEGEHQRALAKSFVIGTPSVSGAGRLHPIPLDQPPGGVAGLVAQAIAIPPVSAAA